MRDGLTTAGELTGCGLLTFGCFQVAAPLGLIVGGALLALLSWLVSR